MFRIRRVYDSTVPRNRRAIEQVQAMLRDRFPLLPHRDIEKLPEHLRNPLKYRFRSILFVAEGARGDLHGFAHLLHAPDLGFCFLDFMSSAGKSAGRGIGAGLYERVREEARLLGYDDLFFEALPDEPSLCRDPVILAENRSRLRFYEGFGARPIVGTRYETPLSAQDDCPPYLAHDDLGTGKPLSRERARTVVRAILERKYGNLCPKEYVEMVVESFRDDPVRIREPRYVRPEVYRKPEAAIPEDRRIVLVVHDAHTIHHVRERGYVESPVRIAALLRELERTPLFSRRMPKRFPEKHIEAVHDPEFLGYLRRVCTGMKPGEMVYPYVFPVRNATRPPKDLETRAGYYCIDTFTPLSRNAWEAARRAVECALTAADALLEGYRLSYALVRPPGHHAERRHFGGFCYLNSNAVAAHYLSKFGRVAILDIDYHHGNGQQDIFQDRKDVLTISIHGHPRFAYPYFSGFEDEKGTGEGAGYNVNMALPEKVDGERYREALERALSRVRRFAPDYLVVALGLDVARGDPTGSWDLGPADFERNGRMIGAVGVPILVVQEGGYIVRRLGVNARWFFDGLWRGAFEAPTVAGGTGIAVRPAGGPAGNPTAGPASGTAPGSSPGRSRR